MSTSSLIIKEKKKKKKEDHNNVLQRSPSAEYSAVNCTLEQSRSMSIH